MKKLVTLFLLIGLIAFIFGCSNGDSSIYLAIEDVHEQKYDIINASGQLPKPIIFSSGAKFETTENNTLAENVVINITKTKSSDTGLNPVGTPEYIYIYRITAKLFDSLGNSKEVKSLEKPLKLTLPTAHLGSKGICYAGVREDKSSAWKYTRLSDNGITTLSQRSIRASNSGNISPTYEFSLYKMGIEIALFAYNKSSEEALKDIACAGITATATPSLLTFDDNGNFLDNLNMAIMIEGDNLSSLKSSDITVSVIYRNQKSIPDEFKFNNQLPKKSETESDDAVTGGNNYVHTLTLNDSNFTASFGGEASISFTLDLKGKSTSDFPQDFMVEVSSVDNIENLIPFTYSNKISFKTEKQKSPDPVQPLFAINYDLDGGSLIEGDTNPDKYSTASETFTLKNPVKAGYSFAGWTGTGLTAPTMVVVIEKGTNGDREYKATWLENAPDTYDLTIVKGTGIASVSEDGSYEAGREITLEYTLEDGYEFLSWTSSDVSINDNKFIMPTKSVTVTANASVITYTISYDGLDGADDVANPATYDVASATITLNNPTKAGWDFLGWTGTGIEEGTASMAVTIPQGSTGPRNYVASWTESISTITLDPQGGDLSAFDWVVDNKITYTSASGTFNLPIPEKTNYYFAGWIYGENAPVREIEISTAENRTYVASWTLAVLTFTLPGDITLEMRYCPAGSFVRGGTNGDGNTVKISKDFYMGTYEVTNEQFEAIMGSSPSSGAGSQFAGPKQPVVYIKWDVIMAEPSGFIAEINSQLASQLPSGYKFALPTEAQWEYACRAGTTTDFNNGETMTESSGNDSAMNEVGWYYFNWGETTYATHEVGGKASNSFGLHDMHGNVFEWCSDWYADLYDSTKLEDPTGPDTGSSRVLRGGSFNFYPTHCTSWYRFSFIPARSSDNFGFRLALVPVPMPE